MKIYRPPDENDDDDMGEYDVEFSTQRCLYGSCNPHESGYRTEITDYVVRNYRGEKVEIQLTPSELREADEYVERWES